MILPRLILYLLSSALLYASEPILISISQSSNKPALLSISIQNHLADTAVMFRKSSFPSRPGFVTIGARYSFIAFFPESEEKRIVECAPQITIGYPKKPSAEFVTVEPKTYFLFSYDLSPEDPELAQRLLRERHIIFWSIGLGFWKTTENGGKENEVDLTGTVLRQSELKRSE